MTTWPSKDSMPSVDLELVGKMLPAEVLYDFDGPCIFTSRTPAQGLVLAYLSEDLDDEGLLRFIVSTTSRFTISELKSGMISVREALLRGSLWLVDLNHRYVPQRAFAVDEADLPTDALPLSSTMLWSSLEPEMVVKLDGPDIVPGKLPAAVFVQAADIAGKALKPIFEWAARGLRQETNGRPPDWLRDIYGLPAQRFSYGSLEVAFRATELPVEQQTTLAGLEEGLPTPRDIQESGWRAVQEGLAWATSDQTLPQGDVADEKWLAILEAMKRLAPGTSGPVVSVDVWGRLIGPSEKRFRLTRDSTRKIRSALTELKKRHGVELTVLSGLIRELDLDRMTMILRGNQPDLQLVLEDDQLLEVARAAHFMELEVRVAARSADNKIWTAVEIQFGHSDGPAAPDDPPAQE